MHAAAHEHEHGHQTEAIAFFFGSGTPFAAAFDADETVPGAVVGSAGIIGPS